MNEQETSPEDRIREMMLDIRKAFAGGEDDAVINIAETLTALARISGCLISTLPDEEYMEAGSYFVSVLCQWTGLARGHDIPKAFRIQ